MGLIRLEEEEELSIVVCTDGHVETARLEVAILLAEGAALAEAVKQAVVTRALHQGVLLSHFGSIEA